MKIFELDRGQTAAHLLTQLSRSLSLSLSKTLFVLTASALNWISQPNLFLMAQEAPIKG